MAASALRTLQKGVSALAEGLRGLIGGSGDWISAAPLAPRQLGLLVALGIVTLAQLTFTFFVRSVTDARSPLLPEPSTFAFDARTLGLGLQEVVLPLALLALLAGRPFFGRLLADTPTRRDRTILLLALLLAQLLFFGYRLGPGQQEFGMVTLGHFAVLIGGLLGGWGIGALLGAFSFVTLGTSELILRFPEVVDLGYIVRWYYFYNLEASSLPWLGAAAGLAAPFLRAWRFAPAAALALGLLLAGSARYFVALTLNNTYDWYQLLLPATLVVGLAAAVVALLARTRLAEEARRRAEATQLALTQAELRALRAQIDPHFLFNSLNTIRYFVRTDPDTARRLINDLSETFQRAMHAGDFVSLAGELKHVEAYLGLAQARLDERLKVIWFIPDRSLLGTEVPTLVLQPLVENAVLHGIAPKPAGGTLLISIQKPRSDLEIRVQDDGVGFDPAEREPRAPVVAEQDPERAAASLRHGPIGLRNIEERLRMIYRGRARLDIDAEPGAGSCVTLTLPLEVPGDRDTPRSEARP